ncbi:hypothetical protein GCM10009592_26410 [Brachybacterium rhamnosum]|uniref:Minor tail protein n=1 Tax=Brachybacterium rhamnosum TaxID=173361 RepID=A0ABW4PZQ8_9MICO
MNVDSELVIAIIVAATSGGGVAAVYRVWVDKRKGARDADAAEAATAIDGFRSLVDSLRGEVDRLRKDREDDRARIDRIEKDIVFERDLRWSAIQYVRVLLTWVSQQLPGAIPPSVPADLAAFIVYTPPTASTDEGETEP